MYACPAGRYRIRFISKERLLRASLPFTLGITDIKILTKCVHFSIDELGL